jgi:hypothetical protein
MGGETYDHFDFINGNVKKRRKICSSVITFEVMDLKKKAIRLFSRRRLLFQIHQKNKRERWFCALLRTKPTLSFIRDARSIP